MGQSAFPVNATSATRVLYRTRTSSGGESANALKSFAEGIDAAFLYAGIDLLHSELFSGPAGDQLYDRTSPYTMRGYSLGSDDRAAEWAELVARLEWLLPLTAHEDGTLPALAEDLMVATEGSLGKLRRLLRLAANQAMNDGTEQVTAATLHSVDRRYPAPTKTSRTRAPKKSTPTDPHVAGEEAAG